MGEEQYEDDCALLEILLSPKAVAHYGTTMIGQQKTDKFGDMQMWHYYGHALPLLKVDKDLSLIHI